MKKQDKLNSEIMECHNHVMNVWAKALIAKRSGDEKLFQSQAKQTYTLESEMAMKVLAMKVYYGEDTTYADIPVGDLLVSAANIDIALEDYENASRLIQYAIMSDTHNEGNKAYYKTKLEECIKYINNGRFTTTTKPKIL